MSDVRKIADDVNRIGQDARERVQRMGKEYQKAAESGLDAASRSFGESNQSFQSLAAEITEYSKRAFDDAIHTWEQLIGVRSVEQAIQIQSQYAKRVYDNHMAELSKLTEMYVEMVRDASKPMEQAFKKFA